MDFSGISNSYFNQITSSVSDESTKRVQNLVDSDLTNADDEKLMDACKQFESYLMEQVMKQMDSMTKALGDEEEKDSNNSMLTYFKGNVMQSLAGDVAEKGDIGLAKQLFEAMKRQQNAVHPDTIAKRTE